MVDLCALYRLDLREFGDKVAWIEKTLQGDRQCQHQHPQPTAHSALALEQGAGKKQKSVTPVVGGWVGGSEYEKGLGSDFFPDIFSRVF
jgi:hypothetical protein